MTSAYKEQHSRYAYKFSYYKLGQRGITNWGSFFITNWGKRILQIGAAFLLQIRARFITNWGRYYKLGQILLQIGAGITNWGKVYYKLRQVLQIGANYYKLGHNTCYAGAVIYKSPEKKIEIT